MHGMLFTKIELDNFDGVFDRFMERLTEDLHMGTVDSAGRPIPQVEWLTMAIVNMAAMMQYGIDDGMIRKALAEETAARKVQKAAQTLQPPHAIIVRDEDHQDDNDTNGLAGKIKNLVIDPAKVETYPLPFANACRLSFAMLRFCLQHPTRLVGLTHVLNPYITTMLTFLATVLKQPAALQLLEYYIPWVDLVAFFNIIPRKMDIRPDPQGKLMGGPPIPEDWCMRGMEWVGRRVYERGFWKIKSNSTGSGSRGSGGPAQPRTGPKIQNEMDVLTEQDVSPDDVMDGVVDDVEGTDVTDTPPAITQRRWRRSAWAAGVLIGCVPGIDMSSDGQLGITPSGTLQSKISAWEAARQRKAQEEMERLRHEEEARGEWALADTSGLGLDVVDSGSDDEGDEPELADLRARRRHLRSLLHQPVRAVQANKKAKISNKVQKPSSLAFLPGYTVLVFDTNVLLSSLELVASLIECRMWTCIVPLPGKSSQISRVGHC
jgi:protein SMG6